MPETSMHRRNPGTPCLLLPKKPLWTCSGRVRPSPSSVYRPNQRSTAMRSSRLCSPAATPSTRSTPNTARSTGIVLSIVGCSTGDARRGRVGPGAPGQRADRAQGGRGRCKVDLAAARLLHPGPAQPARQPVCRSCTTSARWAPCMSCAAFSRVRPHENSGRILLERLTDRESVPTLTLDHGRV